MAADLIATGSAPAVATTTRAAASGAEVSPALAPPPGHPRFPLVDSLRGVAVMAVLLGHVVVAAVPAPRPFFVKALSYPVIGVVLFFVISGFLLYRPFVAARLLGAQPVKIRDYARRRLLRILPAYWTALTLLTIWPGLYGVSERPVVFYGLVQSFRPLLGGLSCPRGPGCGIGPTWSLSVEACFYAVLPLIVILMGRLTRDRNRRTKLITELVVLGCLALASLTIDALWSPAPKPYLVQVLLMPDEFAGTFCWLASGMLLAVLSVAVQDRSAARNAIWTKQSHPMIAWSLALVVYLVTAALLPADPNWPTWNGLTIVAMFISFGVVAVLLISPAIFSDQSEGLVRGVLGRRWLRWLGLISYGIFLWHVPIMQELNAVGVSRGSPHPIMILASLTFALAVACGAASYYLVERPFLQLKDQRSLSGLRASSSIRGLRPAATSAVTARRRTLQPVMTAAVLAVIAFLLAQAVGFGDPRRTQTFVSRGFAIQFKYPAELRGRRIRQPRGISVRVLTAGKYSLVVVRLPLPTASSQQALLGVLRQRELRFLKVHPSDRIRSEVSVRYAGLPGIAFRLTGHRAAVEQWDTLLLDGDIEYKLICQARAGYVAHMEHACSMMLQSLSLR